jgi:hypothetical protein
MVSKSPCVRTTEEISCACMLMGTHWFNLGMVIVLTVFPELSSAAISTGSANVPIPKLTVLTGTGRVIRIPCGGNCNPWHPLRLFTDQGAPPNCWKVKPAIVKEGCNVVGGEVTGKSVKSAHRMKAGILFPSFRWCLSTSCPNCVATSFLGCPSSFLWHASFFGDVVLNRKSS